MFTMTRKIQGTLSLILLLVAGCNAATTANPTGSALTEAVVPKLPSDLLAFSDVSDTSITVNWALATAPVSTTTTTSATTSTASTATTTADPAANFTYQAYYSTSANIATRADALAHGIPIGVATKGITLATLTGLTASTTYYFTVVVMSSATKFSIYPVASQETTAASTATSTATTVSGAVSSTTSTATATADTTPTDTTPPVPGGSGALQFTGLSPHGVAIGWTTATDTVSAPGALEYQVFYSTVSSDVSTLAPSGVGTVGGVSTGPAIASLSATSIVGLTPLTTYWANVVVTDAAGNAALYTASSFTTLAAPDTTPPTAGAAGNITFANTSVTSVTVNWTAATDDTTAPSSLQYEVYRSTSNNIDTIENAQAHGTAIFTTNGSPAWQVNITTAAVTGLSATTAYYFTVFVRDAAGNVRAYVTNMALTVSAPVIYLFATSGHDGSMGGRAGADSICAAQRPISVCPSATTNSIHAMLSFNSSDMIKNMQTTTFNAVGTGNPVAMSSTAAIKTSAGTQVATNFPTLLTNGSSVSIATALSISSSSSYGYWTGAASDGGYTSSVGGYEPSCTGWTNGTNSSPGMTADQTSINTASRFFTGNGLWWCNGSNHPILCLCW